MSLLVVRVFIEIFLSGGIGLTVRLLSGNNTLGSGLNRWVEVLAISNVPCRITASFWTNAEGLMTNIFAGVVIYGDQYGFDDWRLLQWTLTFCLFHILRRRLKLVFI